MDLIVAGFFEHALSSSQRSALQSVLVGFEGSECGRNRPNRTALALENIRKIAGCGLAVLQSSSQARPSPQSLPARVSHP
jgi:hypothetical protein